ncbi:MULTISPECIES: glycosyltransferase [unclassified Janthinobacterium]|uniref:glycosyltransferase n=1 Tax=unclassified Janthinobacterium TaxID=2610881 RepID=UPI00034D95FE|nr:MULTISPECIES: nucleotide disphospho-sugar-binding domain-containing protein [unclassified Janthinobacterium]MEC5161960.1 rhamnosyltransferase subunit B [Janthinobacterium sp. CG_S6]
MNILIVAVGSAGDVYPFIAIGQELKRRGHDVKLFAAAPFQSKVENAGLAFHSGFSQTHFDALVAETELWHPRKGLPIMLKSLGAQTRAGYALLLEHIRGDDTVLVGSSLAFPARLLQESHGVKLATVHLAPACFFSASDPALHGGMAWLRALPAWAVRAVFNLLERTLIDPLVGAQLASVRAELGLAPVRHIMGRWLHSPQRVICAWPAWFAAPRADWPANAVCTGFPRLAAAPGQALGDALQRFLDTGPAPLAATPGSAMAHGRLFFQRAIGAAAALGLRVVLVTPYREQLPEVLPPFAHYEAYVPFDLLAPRVAAFIHHGGIGTCANALAAGKPQLIAPFAYDQPDNAARLRRLGVAACVAPRAPLETWTRALAGLLSQPGTPAACRAIAARMAREPCAAAHIADLIEELGNAAHHATPPARDTTKGASAHAS